MGGIKSKMGTIGSKMGTIGSKMGRKFEQKRKAKWVKKRKFGQGLLLTSVNIHTCVCVCGSLIGSRGE